ncbi:MAG: N(4)-(beta-N-acetylglucosaminyl)-L-asparaginase [bacterium]
MGLTKMGRREFLGTSAAAVAGLPFAFSPVATKAAPKKGKQVLISISSANGLKAVELAVRQMEAGDDPLDAAIAGVNFVENDPDDYSVGYGGLPNERGIVELDAAVMHGPTHCAGAVASLQNIRNPSKVAKLVMEQTDHVLLVGDGALDFARAQGFKEEDLLTEKARRIWLYWKQTLSPVDDWLPPPPDQVDPDIKALVERITGTIHLGALNRAGDLSCVTTTSGLFFKLPGRVGDSPIIGAGLYVDNEIGSVGSTGRGEANLQNLCSFQAVQLMKQGLDPVDAGLEVLREVAKHTTEKHLLDEQGRPNFGLKFYLLRKDGQYAGVTMHGSSQFAVCDENRGARLEDCVALFTP